MHRVLTRFAGAVVVAVFAIAGGAAPSGASHLFQCSDEPVPGGLIQGGSTTGLVQSGFAIQEGGVQAGAVIPGVGTLYVEANALEVAVALTNPGGTILFAAGLDTGGGSLNGREFEQAVCVVVPGLGGNVYLDIDDLDPARPGVTVAVFSCDYNTHACTSLLGHTGVELTVLDPLRSCVYLDGTQRNPFGLGCPAPTPNA